MNISCIIVDDEPLAQKVLERFINQLPNLELINSFSNPEHAYEYLQNNPVDLLFLDIKMPRLTGTNLLRLLAHPPSVIFVTAFAEYAVEGFELEAVDYLLKPFTFERFLQAVKRVQSKIQNEHPKNKGGTLLIRADKKWYPISFRDIRYLQAYGDYVKVFLKDEMLLTKDKLTRMYEEELGKDHFFRTHRSYVISLSAIDYVEGNMAYIDGKAIPVGATHKEALLKLLSKGRH